MDRFIIQLILILITSLVATRGAAAIAESNRSLQFEVVAKWNGAPLAFNQSGPTNRSGQILSVSRCDFLLSDFAVRRRDGTWQTLSNQQAFVSLGDQRSSFALENISSGELDRFRFCAGLCPQINHTDPAIYPADHPLNPNLNGLHWGWSGGFVFFALEGHWRTDAGDVSGFSFHIGHDPQLVTIEIPIDVAGNGSAAIQLELNLDDVFPDQLTPEFCSTHSRAEDAMARTFCAGLARAFSASQVRRQIMAPPKIIDTSAVPLPATRPYRFTFSAQFPVPDLPRDNPLTIEGVELGRRLFSEKTLSINGSQSCASCHQREAAFTDPGARVSRGAEGQTGTRNAMPLFNLAWKKTFFWDGRASTLRQQALMPIENPIEMHETLSNVVSRVRQLAPYPDLFEKAFGHREINSDRLALALEQFLLTLVSCHSKFDRAMLGEVEFSDEEKRGFQLFHTEYDPPRGQFGADCFHCHGGPLFKSQGFANNGLEVTFADVGRSLITGQESDRGKFSVPSLRNVELSGPYMHDGRFRTLDEVVEHYCTGVRRTGTLDPNLAKHPDGGVPLSDSDKRALVAFLKTLTDETLRPGPGGMSADCR
jgi:cytochrome c peroxidase